MLLRLDATLEEATYALLEDLEPSSAEVGLFAELVGDPSASGEALAGALVELLGLPVDDASRVAEERARAIGLARLRAAVDALARALAVRGVSLTTQHRAALALRTTN